MIKIINPADCCGCSACVSICSRNAITMQPDTLGFLYPKVNTDLCTDCGLCEKVCQFNGEYDKSLNLSELDAYAVRHKNINEIEKSRSGAAFVAISDYILEHGGVVYGAGYAEHFRVIHKRATTKEERDGFRGSKYVQSDMNNVFRQVKEDLKNGLVVLFTGTPCQTSGLNAYVGKKLRENLFLVDIVCHGVPGPFLWRDYLAFIEKKRKSKICSVNFRDKDYGWQAHKETYIFKKENRKISFPYTFYQQIMFRYSCHNCHFCNTIRPSDITIGDFWGWEKIIPNFNTDDKGVSLVLINTQKGRKLFECIKNRINLHKVRLEDCLQPNLKNSTKKHPKRDDFENDYKSHGFKYVYYKYGNVGWRFQLRRVKYRLMCKIKSILGI